jgi:hypothetical protein
MLFGKAFEMNSGIVFKQLQTSFYQLLNVDFETIVVAQ